MPQNLVEELREYDDKSVSIFSLRNLDLFGNLPSKLLYYFFKIDL